MRRVPRSMSSKPRSLMPVPASNTRVVSSSRQTSTQDVFPPQRTVAGPGVGTEPRQPQIFRRTATPTLLAPEDRHDADELVGMRKERERGHGDVTIDAVAARGP